MNIGYFFDNYTDAKLYADALFKLMSEHDDQTKFKLRDMTIESSGNKIRFVIIRNPRDVDKIQGHVYDGIFLKSVFTPEVDKFILSRFRPRCACKMNEKADEKVKLTLEYCDENP